LTCKLPANFSGVIPWNLIAGEGNPLLHHPLPSIAFGHTEAGPFVALTMLNTKQCPLTDDVASSTTACTGSLDLDHTVINHITMLQTYAMQMTPIKYSNFISDVFTRYP